MSAFRGPFRFALALLYASSVSSSPYSAPEIEWERILGKPKEDERPIALRESPDHGFFILLRGGLDIRCMKAGPDGAMLWIKSFGNEDSETGVALERDSEGNFIILGSRYIWPPGHHYSYLLKVDPDGNLLWEHVYDTSDPTALCLSEDGGIVFAARDEPEPALTKTDSDGTVLWKRILPLETFSWVNALIAADDGGFAITGYHKPLGMLTYQDLLLAKTDKDGKLLWQRTYGGREDEEGHWLVQSPDGGYVVTGFTQAYSDQGSWAVEWVLKTDREGRKKWERTYSFLRGDRNVGPIYRARGGGYIMVGGARYHPSGVLARLDDRGIALWHMVWRAREGGFGCDVCQVEDGGYVVARPAHDRAGRVAVQLFKVGPDDLPPKFIRGDANADGAISISDVIAVSHWLFLGKRFPCKGAADANDDGAVNISDSVFLIEYLFRSGEAPPPPFRSCGWDTTGDPLECGEYPPCASPAGQ